jgi:Carboxypeptidase regulatory-like domain
MAINAPVQSLAGRFGRHLRIVAATLWLFAVSLGATFAQSIASSALNGTVKDGTGGALPGVTVMITSPALQVGRMVAITGADGSYRFVDLPAGTYTARFELQGFKPFTREQLRLTVGFVARVDAVMQLGGIEESVTVSGQSPVVDVTSTGASVAFTRETLEAVPRGRDLQNVFAMAPGVTQPTPDVGGSNMANRQNISSYGVAAQPKLQVEGMNVTMGSDQSAGVYFMDNTLDEVQIKTSGADAEVSVPGISMVGVLKSGGNEFHGIYAGGFETPTLQATNLDDALRAQGLSATTPLKSFYDVSADLGGRIVRDKLWFYVAQSRQKRAQGLVGFVEEPGPDGRYLTGDEPAADFHSQLDQSTLKLSYQMSKNTRWIYAIQRDVKREPENGAGRFVPLEATRDYTVPHSIQKGELQNSLTDRTLVNVVAGYVGYLTDYNAGRSYGRVDAPPRMDLETGLATGSHPLHQVKPRDRYQADGSISFYPAGAFLGRHELKTGGNVYLDYTTDGYENNLAGNYVLQTDRIGGVSSTPTRIVFRNTPSIPLDRENTYAWYLKDTWRLTSRFTANLGVRWERQHAFLPAQSREAARDAPTVFPAGTYPKTEIGTWTRTVPRVGVAWDLDGKSVVKASVGEYNYVFGDTFGDQYNPNATGTATFSWHDLNGDKLYQPGEVNLNLNGPTSSASRRRAARASTRSRATEDVGGDRELRARAGPELRPPRDVRRPDADRILQQPRAEHPAPVRRVQHPDYSSRSGSGRHSR